MRPEFWIIQKENTATKAFTEPDDYFIEDSYKNQFTKQQNTRKKREINEDIRRLNYDKFVETYEGMRTMLPDEVQVNEENEKERLTD